MIDFEKLTVCHAENDFIESNDFNLYELRMI